VFYHKFYTFDIEMCKNHAAKFKLQKLPNREVVELAVWPRDGTKAYCVEQTAATLKVKEHEPYL